MTKRREGLTMILAYAQLTEAKTNHQNSGTTVIDIELFTFFCTLILGLLIIYLVVDAISVNLTQRAVIAELRPSSEDEAWYEALFFPRQI